VLHVPPDAPLRRIARRCLDSLRERRYYTGMPSQTLIKWLVFSLTEYDAVFFADQDVDPMPLETDAALVRAAWRHQLPVFLRHRRAQQIDRVPAAAARRHAGGGAQHGTPSGAQHGAFAGALHLLGATDASAPLNTGQMLLRPSAALYHDGLRVLRRCRANATHGWDEVGPPRSLQLAPRWFSAVAGGSTRVRPVLDHRLSRPPGFWGAGLWFAKLYNTRAFQKDDWRWVAAAEDQGLFWYVCFVRHDIGAYFNPSGAPAHWVHHHWGQIAGAKAWEGKLWNEPAHLRGEASKRLGANLEYLSRLAPSPTREDTAACGEPMRALRRSAEAHPLTRHYASTSHIQYHASRCAVF